MENEFVLIEKNIYLIDLNNSHLEILLDEFLINNNMQMIMNNHDGRLNTQLQLKTNIFLFSLNKSKTNL
jgi:hypothetical protein